MSELRKKMGAALKKKDHTDAEVFDYNLRIKGEKIKNELYEEFKENNKKILQNNSLHTTNQYSEYLKSKKWKKIREITLKRDKNLCQSCMSKEAEEVHHMTGRYRYNEPFFSLISVCQECHKSITLMDRGLSSEEAPQIKYGFEIK